MGRMLRPTRREINKKRVLKFVKENGKATRSILSQKLKIKYAEASECVKELLKVDKLLKVGADKGNTVFDTPRKHNLEPVADKVDNVNAIKDAGKALIEAVKDLAPGNGVYDVKDLNKEKVAPITPDVEVSEPPNLIETKPVKKVEVIYEPKPSALLRGISRDSDQFLTELTDNIGSHGVDSIKAQLIAFTGTLKKSLHDTGEVANRAEKQLVHTRDAEVDEVLQAFFDIQEETRKSIDTLGERVDLLMSRGIKKETKVL